MDKRKNTVLYWYNKVFLREVNIPNTSLLSGTSTWKTYFKTVSMLLYLKKLKKEEKVLNPDDMRTSSDIKWYGDYNKMRTMKTFIFRLAGKTNKQVTLPFEKDELNVHLDDKAVGSLINHPCWEEV